MIKIARDNDKQAVYDMWKISFDDPDDYMKIYFREKYKSENTLLCFDNGKAVASLQMLPYRFTFCDEEIPIAYLSGLCVLPEARRKGFMSRLIRASFFEMLRREISLTVLVPQEEELMNFYRPFGFEQTFEQGEPMPDLSEIIRTAAGDRDAYQRFDKYFRNRDMTVQKTETDFRTIVQEAALFDFPVKKSLMGMSRVVNAEKLLKIFSKKYPKTKISIKVTDPIIGKNNVVFEIEKGNLYKSDKDKTPQIYLKIATLTQLLLGYKTSEFPEDYRLVFPEKQPMISFMME